MYKKSRLLITSIVLAASAASFAEETTIQGCPSGEILKNFGQFAKTGKMPPRFW